jgi:hypothetical protein
MCHLSDCHVHCVYVCTTEFINWIAVTINLSLLAYFVFFSKYIFPEMKLCSLLPSFYIHVQYHGAIYIFPRSALFGILIFLYCVRELSSAWREGQVTATKQWLAAVSCPPRRFCYESRFHINDLHTNFQFEKLRLIKGTINQCSQYLIWFESFKIRHLY